MDVIKAFDKCYKVAYELATCAAKLSTYWPIAPGAYVTEVITYPLKFLLVVMNWWRQRSKNQAEYSWFKNLDTVAWLGTWIQSLSRRARYLYTVDD